MNYKRLLKVILIVSITMLLYNCAGTSGTSSPSFYMSQEIKTGYVEFDIYFNTSLDGVTFSFDTDLGQPYLETTDGLVNIKSGNKFIIAFDESRSMISLRIDTERQGFFALKNVYGYKWSGDVQVNSYSLGSRTAYTDREPLVPEPENEVEPEEPPLPGDPTQEESPSNGDIHELKNLIKNGEYDSKYDYNHDDVVDIKDLIIYLRRGPIVNNSPYSPTLISPSNNEKGVPTSATLRWYCSDPDGDYLTYDVYFGYYNPPPLLVSDWSNTSYTVSGLSPGTKYYWKIVAKDGKGGFSESSVWSFTTRISGENFELVNEDFEDYYSGYELENEDSLGWGFCLKTGSTLARIVQSYYNGLCLEMKDGDRLGYVVVGATYDDVFFNEGTFKIKMMIPDYSSDNWELIRFYNSENGHYFDVGIGPIPGRGPVLFYSTEEQGYIEYRFIKDVNVGKWYDITIKITGNYYDVYVDGSYAKTGFSWAGEIDTFCAFTPQSFEGHGMIDDIYFEAKVSREKSVLKTSHLNLKEINLNLPTVTINTR